MKLLPLLSAIILSALTFGVNAQTAVIANVSLTEEVKHSRIKQLFSARKDVLKSGTKVKLYLPKESQPYFNFISNGLKTKEMLLQRRFKRILFSGSGTTPEIKSEREILALVKSDPKAIGVISAELVTDDVKVLATY